MAITLTTIKEDITALRHFIEDTIADGFASDMPNSWAEVEDLTATGLDGQAWDSIEQDYPSKTGLKYVLGYVPEEPAPNTLAIRLATQRRSSLTSTHLLVERTYQIAYFGDTNIDVLDVMNLIDTELAQQTKLKVGPEHITLGSFSLSQGFKAQNGTDGMIGILEIETHEQRRMTEPTKIMDVKANVTTNEQETE